MMLPGFLFDSILGQVVGLWVSQLIWGCWLLGRSLGRTVGFGLIFRSMEWGLGAVLDQ